MIEFHKRLLRGYSIILYGNISDQYLRNSHYVSMGSFLQEYFENEGYETIASWDMVEGLSYNNDEMEKQALEFVNKAHGGDSTSQGEGENKRQPPGMKKRKPSIPKYTDPGQAFQFMLTHLRSSSQSSAFFIRWSDKIFSNPDHQSEAEKQQIMQLKRAFEETTYIETGTLEGRKNTLVFLSYNLGCIPPWLYQDNPFVTLIQVGKPERKERIHFISSFYQGFYGSEGLTEPVSEKLAGDFADLTEGLTAWDLEAIRRTSIAEDISITQPKVLVDYFKYGKRDDPWEKLDGEKITNAEKNLSKRVIGQPAAITAVVDMLLSARIGISMTDSGPKTGKPKGTFFFVGPTGVGKTELAKALTELIFGDETAFARFDMSEYAEEHAAEKLTGSPPGYVGYDEGGHLTNRVMEKPFSLLLFDEIEKAHGRVMDKFLQILEDGRLTDGKGQTAYFSQSVIIFTSNIGSQGLELTNQGAQPYEKVKEHYLNAVEDHFKNRLGRPELFNRLGSNILVFDLLRSQHIEGIGRKFLKTLEESARSRRNLYLVFPQDSILTMIQEEMLKGDNILYGGRRVKTLLEDRLERPLNKWIFFNDPPNDSTLSIIPLSHKSGIDIQIQQ